MASPSEHDFALFLLQLSIVLSFVLALGGLFRRFGQAAVVGEILAGLLLGPSGLGFVAPEIFNALFPKNSTQMLGSLAWLGSIFLLFAAGMEVDLNLLAAKRRIIFNTSLFAIGLPFTLGLIFGAVVPDAYLVDPERRWIFALFAATAMSISAVPVVAKVLMDLDLLRFAVGQLIIGTAVVNDIVGWLFFAMLLSLMTGGVIVGGSILWVIVLTLVFTAFCLSLGRKLVSRLFASIQRLGVAREGFLGIGLLIAFFCAAFTQWIGIHAVFGAFLAGAMVGATGDIKESLRWSLRDIVFYLFAPIFFASMGFRVNFIANFDTALVVSMVAIACVGKAAGAVSGAFFGGLSRRDALTVGFGLMPTGAMGLILAFLALEHGLINERVFVALTAVAIVTSWLSGPLMQWARADGKDAVPKTASEA
ncbi:MAG TPA: cation:proton antiporter [Candidatus Binatia bacterium]|jgi:Kef-type K+ transport system membrane component KefB